LGHIDGQFVNPKEISLYLPLYDASVTGFPLSSIRLNLLVTLVTSAGWQTLVEVFKFDDWFNKAATRYPRSRANIAVGRRSKNLFFADKSKFPLISFDSYSW